METISQKVSDPASKARQEFLGRPENPAVQKLLDVAAAVIAEEYILAARKDPVVFREIASGPAAPRNEVEGGAPNDMEAK